MERKISFGAVNLLCIAFVILGDHRTDATTNYCDKEWQCGPFKHFMCEFKKNKKTDKCSKIDIRITADQRVSIVELVNGFRNSLAGGQEPAFPGGATNIQQITWDSELESFAEVYGSQCGGKKVPELDVCAKTREFKEGARSLWGVFENDKLTDIITGPDGWISVVPEPSVVESFEPVDGEDRLEPNYGRYTMLAWAGTHKIGCTIITCSCSPVTGGARKLVCFLGPSGNIKGKPVFTAGQPCKSCPPGTACNPNSAWSKLCARKGDPDKVRGKSFSKAASFHFSYNVHIGLLAAVWSRD